MRKISSKGIYLLIISTMLTFFIGSSTFAYSSSKGLIISYIDVGQADSCLIQLNGINMLIDAGNRDDDVKVIDYLKKHNVKNLEYVIGTHPHEDHIGGLASVLNTIPSKTIIMPKAKTNTITFKNLLLTIQKLRKKITVPIPGTNYRLSDAVFTILAPNSNNYDDLNNYSVVIRLVYKNKAFIFQGDCEAQSENEILANGFNIKSDVIKIGHHGSRSSSTESYLQKVNPKYAVISCGKDNDYGHPHAETVDKLNKLKIKLYRTDLNGTIVCKSDGNSIAFTTEKLDGNESLTNQKKFSVAPQSSNFVYITKSGTKYHRDDCPTLKGTKYKIAISQAKSKGLSACKICKP